MVGGSGLPDGRLERAWTDTISVSKPLACPGFCNCKYDIMNCCLIYMHVEDVHIDRFSKIVSQSSVVIPTR